MESEKTTAKVPSWTWADQISSYKFWGVFLFFLFLIIPNAILNLSIPIFGVSYGISSSEISIAIVVKSVASISGFWLAWFMVRMKNHYLLFLYSGFIIIGLLLVLMMHPLSILLGFFLIGLGFGAISLAIPTIISGGKGGSEMFVVSFGLITFYELIAWTSMSGLSRILYNNIPISKGCIIIGLLFAVIGTILLLPVKAELFNVPPPERKKLLTPVHREPIIVALLCLIPGFNIYYAIHITYRLHGEVNQINPTQNILSPGAAAWCSIFLGVLSPVMMSSLNTNVTLKLKENNAVRYYKTWAVIFWSFFFIPISYALIQSNLNQLIQEDSGAIKG